MSILQRAIRAFSGKTEQLPPPRHSQRLASGFGTEFLKSREITSSLEQDVASSTVDWMQAAMKSLKARAPKVRRSPSVRTMIEKQGLKLNEREALREAAEISASATA